MKILFCLLLICAGQNVWAWGDMGHQTTAAVAETQLTHEAQALMTLILGPESLYMAATWPDHVRDDRLRYGPFANYHFCEVLGHDLTDAELLAQIDHKDNCYSVLSKAKAILLSPNATPNQKMITLRYLIHVVGDVHQPLHVGNGLDMGGNLCDITLDTNGKTVKMNLHSFWDSVPDDVLKDLLKDSAKKVYDGYNVISKNLLAHKDEILTPEDTVSVDPLLWTKEAIARRALTYAALDAQVGFTDRDEKKRPYCKYLEFDGRIENKIDKNYNPGKIPHVDAAYWAQAKTTVRHQLLLGGLRLAAVLNDIAASKKACSRYDSDPQGLIELKSLRAVLNK